MLLAELNKQTLARAIDFSVLPKETTADEIRRGCELTRQYHFAAFYSSSPYWSPLIKEELSDFPDIEIGTGIAFPFGSCPPEIKAFEVDAAIKSDCTAVDMVMNVGALKSGDFLTVERELDLFIQSAQGAVTKYILDVCFLNETELKTAAKMAIDRGVNFVKTSTGQYAGPTLKQILLLREMIKGTPVKLKVAGVKDPRPTNAIALLLAGVSRIGTRAGAEIVDGLEDYKRAFEQTDINM